MDLGTKRTAFLNLSSHHGNQASTCLKVQGNVYNSPCYKMKLAVPAQEVYEVDSD